MHFILATLTIILLPCALFSQGKAKKIFSSVNSIKTLAISPNGKSIAFSSDARDQKGDIVVLDIETGIKRLITKTDALESQPVWSPNGKNIYYFSNQKTNGGIYKINANGGKAEALTNEKFWCEFPTISPDGKRLAYYSRRGGTYHIYEMNLATKKEKRFTQGSFFYFGPPLFKRW